MRTIYKYSLFPKDSQDIAMPQDAQILSVQVQGDNICVWVLVDLSRPSAMRTITMVGTGHALPSRITHYSDVFIGTVQLYGSSLVLHVFVSKE